MPTAGSATYTLAAATRPTFNTGALQPGTLTSASLSVSFGGKATYVFNARLTIPEAAGNRVYTLKTTTDSFLNSLATIAVNGATTGAPG